MEEKNTQGVVLNSAKNTQGVVLNTTEQTQSLIKKLDEEIKEIKKAVKPNVDLSNITEEQVKYTKRAIKKVMDLPADDPLKILGSFVDVVGNNPDDNVFIEEGKTKNAKGDLVNFSDEGLKFNFASMAKTIYYVFVNNLAIKGILRYTEPIDNYIPSWDPSNLVVLRDLQTLPDGTQTVLGADGVSRIQIFSSDGSLSEPLETLKEKLEKVKRKITIQDLLYFTAGFTSELFAPFYANAVYKSNASMSFANSSFDMVWNYGEKIGCSAVQPGEMLVYQKSQEMLSGVIEVIYNNVVNKVPLGSSMNVNSDYQLLSVILENELLKDFDCTLKDDLLCTPYDVDEDLSKIVPWINHNDTCYYVTSLATAAAEVGDDWILKKIFPAGIYKEFKPYDNLFWPNQDTGYRAVSDLSGLYTHMSLRLYRRISSVLHNNGLYKGKRINSNITIKNAFSPILPNDFMYQSPVDLDGNGYSALGYRGGTITQYGTMGSMSLWLNGATAISGSGLRNLVDPSVNGGLITHYNGVSIVSNMNCSLLWFVPAFAGVKYANDLNKLFGLTTSFVQTAIANLDIDIEPNIFATTMNANMINDLRPSQYN